MESHLEESERWMSKCRRDVEAFVAQAEESLAVQSA